MSTACNLIAVLQEASILSGKKDIGDGQSGDDLLREAGSCLLPFYPRRKML